MDNNKNQQQHPEKLIEILERMEARVSRLENYLGISQGAQIEPKLKEGQEIVTGEASLEFKIGIYWLAQVGAVILLLGIAFFISYPFPAIPPLLASFFGYIAVAALFGLSVYWRKGFPYLSRILFGGSLILLYFASLRLHFFTANPVITNKTLGLMLLVLVLAVNLFVAIKRKSQLLAIINLFLCYVTGLFSDTSHFVLIFITATSLVAIYFLIKYNWHAVAIINLMMVNTTHLLWLLNNPVLGNPIQPILEHHYSILYLVVYGSIYALVNVFRSKDTYTEFFEILISVLNSIGIFSVGAFIVLIFFKSQLSLFCLFTSFLFLSFAIINWKHTRSGYSTSNYAIFGYIALSISIFTNFSFPNYLIWLGLQSLLVIITALWFRSRNIVIANILIYLGIFTTYLAISPPNDFVNLSYAVTALVSARILNWKKHRLELKTDLLRNTYLACTFIIVLYGLYHAVPSIYVSLSWLGAALFYLGLSLLLKNIKYRWMMILTIFATVIHVFVIDMSKLSAGFRIIIFLAVGIVILTLSLFYTRYRKLILKSE